MSCKYGQTMYGVPYWPGVYATSMSVLCNTCKYAIIHRISAIYFMSSLVYIVSMAQWNVCIQASNTRVLLVPMHPLRMCYSSWIMCMLEYI